jgi:hypothetical protein
MLPRSGKPSGSRLRLDLRQDLMNDPAMNVSQSPFESIVAERQSFMIDA